MKITMNGHEVDFDTAVALMDDELREELHAEIAPCDEQKFIDAYCEKHFAKYGKEFTV